jgi:hypothetical protein
MSKFAKQFYTTFSYIIRIVEPHKNVNAKDLKAIVVQLSEMEK